MKTNRSDLRDLAERAALCVAVVVRELQKMEAAELQNRMDDVGELLRCVQLWNTCQILLTSS